MEIYDMPRYSGKTRKLLGQLLINPDAILITSTSMWATRLQKSLWNTGFATQSEIEKRIIPIALYDHTKVPYDAVILIDELDSVLWKLLRRNVDKATLTGDQHGR